MPNTDYAATVEELLAADRGFLRDVRHLETRVSEKDGMLAANERYYFACGRSAIDVVEAALKFCGPKSKSQIRNVLDFACGYGRVLRWLKAYFDQADVVAVDVDTNGVAFINSIFPETAQAIRTDWEDVPRDRFDLIWVGSLLTHLNEEKCRRLLSLLCSRLEAGGIIVATTHGPYVEGRIRREEKLYNLSKPSARKLVDDYAQNGFGFAEYDSMEGYGISVSSISKLEEFCATAGLQVSLFIRQGWMKHQDCICCTRAPSD